MIDDKLILQDMFHFAELLGDAENLAEGSVLTLKRLRNRAFEAGSPLTGIEVSIKFFIPKPAEII